MAESQHPFEYASQVEGALTGALTKSRLGKFLVKGGYDFPLTMEWYLWNARLTKSLQFPMHAAEVTLRNAVAHHLALLGAPSEWAFDTAILNSLAKKSSHTRESLNTAKRRLLRSKMKSVDYERQVESVNHLDIPSFYLITTDDVVAKLSFEFWTGLLGKEFENDWHTTIRRVFPSLPPGTSRRDIWLIADEAKELRNRMAHHEPILHLPLADAHDAILALVGYRCRETRAWVRHFSTFQSVLSEEPRGVAAAQPDEIRILVRPVFQVTDMSTEIGALLPQISKKDSGGVLLVSDGAARLFVTADLIAWLNGERDEVLADLSMPMSQVLTKVELTHRCEVVSPDLSFGAAGAKFYARNIPTKKKPTAFVVTVDGSLAGDVLGVVFKEQVVPTKTKAA
ncbi:hypothetical protein ELG88_08370 [Rhizobium leguminosarum]|uniref:Abi family protein n=1 Tax=Rhizobium leguminosarum TaxID=384 RepID=UPI0010302335|nr:Abi family protein [Rhizobium leguminosarum]TBF35228.1 hypothetical protein ELG88_08370 [Rhizobium leguminosarum]